MVFGTFDYLHPGHIHFFKQARALAKNPFLIVSVAREKNTERIKGVSPENTEVDRVELLTQCRLVDRAVLGAKINFFTHILEQEPVIIALGYDQTAYVNELMAFLKKSANTIKVIRLEAYKERVHKTSLKKRTNKGGMLN